MSFPALERGLSREISRARHRIEVRVVFEGNRDGPISEHAEVRDDADGNVWLSARTDQTEILDNREILTDGTGEIVHRILVHDVPQILPVGISRGPMGAAD